MVNTFQQLYIRSSALNVVFSAIDGFSHLEVYLYIYHLFQSSFFPLVATCFDSRKEEREWRIVWWKTSPMTACQRFDCCAWRKGLVRPSTCFQDPLVSKVTTPPNMPSRHTHLEWGTSSSRPLPPRLWVPDPSTTSAPRWRVEGRTAPPSTPSPAVHDPSAPLAVRLQVSQMLSKHHHHILRQSHGILWPLDSGSIAKALKHALCLVYKL